MLKISLQTLRILSLFRPFNPGFIRRSAVVGVKSRGQSYVGPVQKDVKERGVRRKYKLKNTGAIFIVTFNSRMVL